MRPNRSIERQLQRLEQIIVKQEAVVDEQAERAAARHAIYQAKVDAYWAALDRLVAALPGDLQQMACKEAEREGYSRIHQGFHCAPPLDLSPLLLAICTVAGENRHRMEHGGGKPVPPLELPETMARWFVEYGAKAQSDDPLFFNFNAPDCEDCGYRVPANREQYFADEKNKELHRKGIASSAMPFPRCPVCGGVTGFIAYITKNNYPFSEGRVSYGDWAAGKEKPY